MLLKPGGLGVITLEEILSQDCRLQDERERKKLLYEPRPKAMKECWSLNLAKSEIRPHLKEVASLKLGRPWNPGEKERS
jgi:hypothetical protein